ncbi:GNAT family N-acetyltransferase [Nonomuraea sp. NN258]|uniref:GNAT family N-acetyltransferase n=1 Tax=Nonomuraea antri TaxID=2730852 RepID=UPI00156916E5|nr:GNAT family N-acetyltransferase [Nonomuraea antri]NRQ37620.1 GNAT family N-acetyltransferase [Nonomuraea antri]
MDIYLETERLVLRRLAESDADDLVALHNDPEVMFYINGGRPTPREEVVGEELPVFMDRLFLAAIEKSTGAFLGWFHLRAQRGEPEDEPELGYRLHKSAWGKGYATEGSRALVDHAFRVLGARRVYAETMTVNTASRRVMEKSGLRYVRTFFQDWPDHIEGEELGDVEYELLRSDWARRT